MALRSALEVLREIRRASRDVVSSPASTIVDGPVRAERRLGVAWRIYSRLLQQELWICADEEIAADIAAEEPLVPAFTIEEAARLREKPLELLRAIVAVKQEFPGARLVI